MSQPKERASRPSKVHLVIIFRGRQFSTAGGIVATGSQTAAATICPKVVIYHVISRQTLQMQLKTSDLLTSCQSCDQMFCLHVQTRRVTTESLQRSPRSTSQSPPPQTGRSPNLRVLDFTVVFFLSGGLGGRDIKPGQRSNLLEYP